MNIALADAGNDGLWELNHLHYLHCLHCLNDLHCLHLWMSTISYFDCLGHEELENIAHDGRRVFIEFVSWQDGMDGS